MLEMDRNLAQNDPRNTAFNVKAKTSRVQDLSLSTLLYLEDLLRKLLLLPQSTKVHYHIKKMLDPALPNTVVLGSADIVDVISIRGVKYVDKLRYVVRQGLSLCTRAKTQMPKR